MGCLFEQKLPPVLCIPFYFSRFYTPLLLSETVWAVVHERVTQTEGAEKEEA